MDIVIPTYGRAELVKQTTLRQLTDAGIRPHVVVQERERHLWDHAAVKLHVLPDNIRTIAPTRQWIVENVGVDECLVMLDDDLVFYKRRTDEPTKLRDITAAELFTAFRTMERVLGANGVAHVGFAAREGANRCIQSLMYNTRIMRVLGYRRDILRKECITFGRLEVMEDFDVALRLLRAGYRNVVLNEFAHNQAGSGKEGGCSHFRTKELHAACARKLADLHPGFVHVVEKTTKGAWGGGTRTDVTISWKKAYETGRSLR